MTPLLIAKIVRLTEERLLQGVRNSADCRSEIMLLSHITCHLVLAVHPLPDDLENRTVFLLEQELLRIIVSKIEGIQNFNFKFGSFSKRSLV